MRPLVEVEARRDVGEVLAVLHVFVARVVLRLAVQVHSHPGCGIATRAQTPTSRVNSDTASYSSN